MKIQKGLEKGILVILFAFIAIIVVCSFIKIGTFKNEMYGSPVFSYLIVIVLTSFLFVLFYRVSLKIDTLSRKQLIILQSIFCGIIVLTQLFLVFMFDVTQITDALMINDEARSIASGLSKKISDDSAYFAIYQNNNFAVIIQVLFYKVIRFFGLSIKNSNYLELLNIIFIDSAIFFLCRAARLIKGSKFALKVLMFCVLNPFNYLLLFWSYTLVYSLPLTFLIVCLGIELLHKPHKIWQKAVLCGAITIFSIVGYYIRPTIVIPTFALIVYWILRVKKEKPQVKRALVIVGAVVLAAVLTTLSINLLQNKYSSSKTNRSFPLTHWVMMGLSDDGKIKPDDFYITFQEQTSDKMKEADIKEIKRRMSEYNALTFSKHLAVKMGTTWSDGTGNASVFMQTDKNQSRLWNWLGGDRNELFLLFCQAFRLFVLLLALYNVALQIKTPRKYKYRPIIGIILFGAILFYLIWEAKEVYSAPFIPFLFILGTYAIEHLEHKKTTYKPFKITSVAVIVCTLVLGVLGIRGACYTNYKWKDYSINTEMNRFFLYKDSVSTLSQNNMKIMQNFIPDKDFSTLEIQCDPIYGPTNKTYRKYWDKWVKKSSTSYIIKLTDKEGKLIKQKKLKATGINHEYGLTKWKVGSTRGEKKYRLWITPNKAGEKDTVRWSWLKVKNTNQYKGQGYLNGSPIPDLNIRVYQEYKGPYTVLWKYLMGFGAVLLMEILVAISYLRKTKKTQ